MSEQDPQVPRQNGRGALPRTVGRIALGLALAFAGTTHLTVARDEFQAQVPAWVPVDRDLVVLGSGAVEITLAVALLAAAKHRVLVGFVVAGFFIAVFPGNISQFVTRTDAFGLNTDRDRFIRLLFQPPLVVWALWSTGAWQAIRRVWQRRVRGARR